MIALSIMSMSRLALFFELEYKIPSSCIPTRARAHEGAIDITFGAIIFTNSPSITLVCNLLCHSFASKLFGISAADLDQREHTRKGIGYSQALVK